MFIVSESVCWERALVAGGGYAAAGRGAGHWLAVLVWLRCVRVRVPDVSIT